MSVTTTTHETVPGTRRTLLLVGGTLLVGAFLTALVASARSMSRSHFFELLVIAAGAALVAGALGTLALGLARRRPIGVQVTIVTLTAVGAAGLGAWSAARRMFISNADAAALDVVLVAAGTVGVAAAVLLGNRVSRASHALAERTRRIGDGVAVEAGDAPARSVGPGEWARLARELDDMSQRLRESREREQAMEQSRRELVAWVSHDLRTPLAGIRALAEALEDGVVTDPGVVAEYHTTVRTQADRLAELVDDLFELSRVEAGVVRPEREQVPLADLVSDALAGVEGVAAAKGVQVEGRMVGTPPELRCSPVDVLRVLRNLLENAIRHTPVDGTVVVEAGNGAGVSAASVDGGGDVPAAWVSVCDDGGGIPEADLDRVFDTAYRADPARPADGGAGLGLTIARGLVEAHGGHIEVRNDNGGARFTVVLPLDPGPPGGGDVHRPVATA
ncbi:MAG: HAMP domain-containing sensor histidine kinase [Acidimicrobiia bacterium]